MKFQIPSALKCGLGPRGKYALGGMPPPRSLDFAHARSVFEKFSRVKFFAPPYADSVKLARLALGPAQACGAKSEYQKSPAPAPRRFTSCACKPARACKAIRTALRSEKKDEICPRARLCLRGGILNFIVYFACVALVKFHRGAFRSSRCLAARLPLARHSAAMP